MDPLHIEYLKEIYEAEVPVWDDKYNNIETTFEILNMHLMLAFDKIFNMYRDNTDLNIDKRFYNLIRHHSEKIRYSINYAMIAYKDEDLQLRTNVAYASYQIDSFCTADYLKEYYKNCELPQFIFKKYGKELIRSESIEQYILFLRAVTLCDVKDCVELIPHVNLDNEEFSTTYQRILPFIKTVTSGLRTKSAAKN